ncbi:MAG: hypothetical protein CL943_02225 [Candidatus Diapherotrites archaeon]|uniref:Uncharacterized protein n=1 Tax=Candidatus Iainarchaeum sp. TaxID=3101447 RepID=A0A2D6M0Z4_9ARCH|nr:hypothetical protein [Candidatus Diapherotrites archaeon]
MKRKLGVSLLLAVLLVSTFFLFNAPITGFFGLSAADSDVKDSAETVEEESDGGFEAGLSYEVLKKNQYFS